MRSRSLAQDGATAVEFALIFPLALAFVGVLLVGGFYMLAYASANNIARDAARYASIRTGGSLSAPYPDDAAVTSHVEDGTHALLGSPDVIVASSGSGTGDEVTVTVTYQDVAILNAAAGFVALLGFSDADFDVSRSVTVRRE